MSDATGGTHAETDAVEPQRKTLLYPGEPDADDGADQDELHDLEAAINDEI